MFFGMVVSSGLKGSLIAAINTKARGQDHADEGYTGRFAGRWGGRKTLSLTRDRAKPAVPFGGNYRIIDITLSNCINSDLRHVYIMTQYKALSLNRHIREGWTSS